jgi:hypothetical protein
MNNKNKNEFTLEIPKLSPHKQSRFKKVPT